jgi:hypothetical protein
MNSLSVVGSSTCRTLRLGYNPSIQYTMAVLIAFGFKKVVQKPDKPSPLKAVPYRVVKHFIQQCIDNDRC